MQSDRLLGCLIMAAGNATRFQSNKLLAPLDGRPLISYTLASVPHAVFHRLLVVTQYPQIAALAKQFGYECLQNTRPEDGLSRTIRLGTDALRDCDAIVYLVADQPLLRAESIRRLVSAWQLEPDCIHSVSHQGQRGNPVLFPRCFFDELCALSGDCGGSVVIRRHPERLRMVEAAREELADIDTPQALARLQEAVEPKI